MLRHFNIDASTNSFVLKTATILPHPIVGVSRPLNDETEEVVLKLSQELYPYIKTKPIHHSQKNYDDEFKVVIKVIINKELEMLLNSFGIGLSS